jgi:predicted nucleotidyltransferase
LTNDYKLYIIDYRKYAKGESMIEKLFSSKARVEVLKLFVFHPDESFYQRQIAHLTGQPIRAIQRELDKFNALGLIETLPQGNRVYYRVNKQCPIYPDLKNIILKTAGIAEVLKSAFQKSRSIKTAFIYGSFAKGNEKLTSDIDFFVIGSITLKELSGMLSGVKRELGREINYTVFPTDEFVQKAAQGDHFLQTVLREKKIFVLGNEHELKKIIAAGKASAA